MNTYQLVSVIRALILYFPLGYQILKSPVTQNLATFILWGSLDAIAGASMIAQGSGNYQLPFAYVLGCVIVIACVLKSGKYSWTRVETAISILVLVCITAWLVIVWVFHNPWLATVLSTTGVVLAGAPQIRDSWRKPEESPFMIYVGFTFVNVLSVMGGASWTAEERLYSGSCTILCGLVTAISARKFSRQ